jgi:hypothetical protein
VTVVREEKKVGKQCFELYGVRVLEHHSVRLEHHSVLQIKPGTFVSAEFQVLIFSVLGGPRRCLIRDGGLRGKEGWKAVL